MLLCQRTCARSDLDDRAEVRQDAQRAVIGHCPRKLVHKLRRLQRHQVPQLLPARLHAMGNRLNCWGSPLENRFRVRSEVLPLACFAWLSDSTSLWNSVESGLPLYIGVTLFATSSVGSTGRMVGHGTVINPYLLVSCMLLEGCTRVWGRRPLAQTCCAPVVYNPDGMVLVGTCESVSESSEVTSSGHDACSSLKRCRASMGCSRHASGSDAVFRFFRSPSSSTIRR